MKTWVVAAVVACAVPAADLRAITVVPMTFEQLVDEAAAVVYARVSRVRGQWTEDRRGIDSVISLEALRYFKGDLGELVPLRLPGGEAGGRVHVLPGAPVLREGDLVVVFLAARGPAIPTAVGLGQGIFRVTGSSTGGAPLVTPPLLKASPAGRIVRGDAARRALTLDAFAAHVRARMVDQ